MKTRLTPVLLLPALLAACDAGEDPERVAMREAAARQACVAEELLIQSREALETLGPVAGEGTPPEGPIGAAYTFARTYHDYAELRAAQLAYADSALRARTSADSARYVERGARYAASPPVPGTVEANVAAQYLRNFQAILATPQHYCNREPLAPAAGEE